MKNFNQVASDLIALLYSPFRQSHDPHVSLNLDHVIWQFQNFEISTCVTCSKIHSYVHVGLYQQRLHLQRLH